MLLMTVGRSRLAWMLESKQSRRLRSGWRGRDIQATFDVTRTSLGDERAFGCGRAMMSGGTMAPVAARKILIMGLPGTGKTTLANILVPRLNAVHFNADAIRANVNKGLGFTHDDRIEQARRMGWLCERVVEAGTYAIADFVCPTKQTRAAFGEAFVIWVDRIK